MAHEVRTGRATLVEQADEVSSLAINLAKEADKEFPGIKPTVVENQRWYMIRFVGLIFFLLNAAVVGLICWAIRIDQNFIAAHPELVDKRIINGTVFETLIGATVVQTGAITWAMARFLFPNPSE
jgi:multisubunit Na+/H+ antiporter MnhB subunit